VRKIFISAVLSVVLSVVLISVVTTGVVSAEDLPAPPEPNKFQSPIAEVQAAERIDAVGSSFQLTNSQYLHISLYSSLPIKLVLESVPEMITMRIESISQEVSAEITLAGLAPLMTYHKYEDDYHNHLEFTSDDIGKFTYTQDLSQSHLIFIQPRPSTIYLKDTGWSNPAVGTGTR